MADKTPSEIIARYNTAIQANQPLIDRLEVDMEHYVGEPYAESQVKGDYENATVNRASVFGKKVVAMLADGKPSFSFKLEKETQKQRESLSMTERFVYYAFAEADKRLRMLLQSPIHAKASFDVSIRGFVIPRVFVHPDKKGNAVFDVQFLPATSTAWWMGDSGLSEVCSRKQMTRGEANRKYPDSVMTWSGDETQDIIDVYDYINDEIQRTIVNGEWATKPYKHKKGYVPVMVFGNATSPIIESDTIENPIRLQWESIYAPNRNLYDMASKLFTYYQTTVADGVRGAWNGEYDSTLSGGVEPKLTSYPGNKGNINWVDVSKKQKLTPPLNQIMPKDAFALWQILDSQLSMGELSKVSYGQMEAGAPAAAIALLLEADSQLLKPFRQTIEEAEQWIAMELIKQTKDGKFKELAGAGTDAKGLPFSVKVNIAELVDDTPIGCELVMDNRRDELTKVGILLELVKAKVGSKQMARNNLPSLFPDTDAEQDVIDRETASEFPSIQARQWLNAFMQDRKGMKGNEAIIQALTDYIAIVDSKVKPPSPTEGLTGQGQGGDVRGIPSGVTPQAVVAGQQQGEQIQVPPEIQAAARGEQDRTVRAGQV